MLGRLVEPQWIDKKFVEKYTIMEASSEDVFEFKVNMPSVIRLIPDNTEGILDYACGTGYLTEAINKIPQLCRGGVDSYDISPVMRGIAHSNGANVIEDERQLFQKKYGAVILKLVLQFIDDIDTSLAKITGLIKPGGSVIISIPNPDRTAQIYNGPYNKSWRYINEVGDFGLYCTMIHRPFEDIHDNFAKKGFYMSAIQKVTDEARGDILPKRLNARFTLSEQK